jgi:hypothetical protein
MRSGSPVLLTDADRERLARLLGMIGSCHDGEALNARLADRFIRERGLTWSEVIAPTLPPPASERTQRPEREPFVLYEWPVRWRGAVQLCLQAAGLDDWQQGFVRKLATYAHQPSAKQLDILRAIAERVLAGGAP